MRFSKHLLPFVCAALLAGAIPANAQKQDKNKPSLIPPPPRTPYSNVKRDFLLNGLQVISLERPGDSLVKCDLVIRTGAMFDLVGKTGLAALTLQTLLAANPQVKEELESLQAKIEWGVNWDTTWFKLETPPKNVDAVLEIVARLLVVENVRPELFKRAQQAQLEKIKAQQLSPAERADEAFLKAIYGDYPYGHNIDGNELTINGIKQGDVFDFLRRFYLANNVSAILVGNVSQTRVMKAFKIFFGGWTKGQPVPSTFRAPLSVSQLRLVKVEAGDSPNIEIRGGFLGVKHTDPDFLTTEALAKVLSARLQQSGDSAPRDFSVHAPPRILPGPFYFSAAASADQAQGFSRRATESLSALATGTVSAEELSAAKSSLAADYTARSVEHFLREIEVYSFPRNYPETVGPKIDKITAADLQRVAKKMFDHNALTVVALGKVNESFKLNP